MLCNKDPFNGIQNDPGRSWMGPSVALQLHSYIVLSELSVKTYISLTYPRRQPPSQLKSPFPQFKDIKKTSRKLGQEDRLLAFHTLSTTSKIAKWNSGSISRSCFFFFIQILDHVKWIYNAKVKAMLLFTFMQVIVVDKCEKQHHTLVKVNVNLRSSSYELSPTSYSTLSVMQAARDRS